MLTALSASLWVLIVIKANPLASFLFSFMIRETEVTSPACANKVFNSSCVVNRERFRTDTLTSIMTTSSELTSLMKKPPAHNVVGGYHTTQIQIFVLYCSVQC